MLPPVYHHHGDNDQNSYQFSQGFSPPFYNARLCLQRLALGNSLTTPHLGGIAKSIKFTVLALPPKGLCEILMCDKYKYHNHNKKTTINLFISQREKHEKS